MKERIVSNEEIRNPILRVYIQKAILAGLASHNITKIENKEALEAILIKTTNELNERLTSIEEFDLAEKKDAEPEPHAPPEEIPTEEPEK